MKADVVFIGGGLAALVAGIKLLENGLSVIIISAGQSALHFSSGSLCAMNRYNDTEVHSPLEYIDLLPPDHPYRKVGGASATCTLLKEAEVIMRRAGIELTGTLERNHYRLTPFGVFTPAWLTLSDHLTLDSLDKVPYRKAAIIGIEGFLDFYPDFIAKGLKKIGFETVKSTVNTPEFNLLRNNPTEMRAPNIARTLTEEGLENYAYALNRKIYDCDVAIIPAVVGLNDNEPVKQLASMVNCDLYSVSTIPVAVPGIRMKILLQEYFTSLGGWYLMGDSATDGIFENDYLRSINTANLGNTPVKADRFVLATGGLFSRGLKSDINHVWEPVFDLDVDFEQDRARWYDKNFYQPQPFMKFGVKTDEHFRCSLQGKTLRNLYAIGSVLGGDFNPLTDGVGAGVTLASAMYVANKCLE